MKHIRPALLIALTLALAGCGGGSSGTHTTPIVAASSGASAQGGTAQFALTIPNTIAAPAAQGRRPQYISPSTQSANIIVNGANNGFDLSTGSPLCTTATNGRTCTLKVAAPIGTVTFNVILYSGVLSGNTPTGSALSAASSFMRTITEGAANVSTPLILGGIPVTADVQVPGLIAHMGSAGYSLPVYLSLYDNSGNLIIGPSPYVDTSFTASVATLSTAIVSSQVALANPTTFGSSITVTSPADAPVLRFNGNQDILGIAFIVTEGGRTLPGHTSTTSQSVAVSGTLTATNIYQVGLMPDYANFAPSDSSLGTNVKNGFVFDNGNQGDAGLIGYFDSSTESVHQCSFSNAQSGVAPIDGGIATGYAAANYADTAPWGLAYFPYSTFTGGACAFTSEYRTDTLGDGVASSLVYDQTAPKNLVEGTDSSGGMAALNQVTYNGAGAYSSLTALLTGTRPRSLVVHNGYRFYEEQTNQVYRQTGGGGPSSLTVSGATITSLAIGYDGRTYALDSAGRIVYVYDGTSSPTHAYSSAQFAFFPRTSAWALAIGPDGNAYSDNGNGVGGQLTPTGTSNAMSLPGYGGNSIEQGLFDGHNGYVYAYIATGTAGETVIDRISY